jgi:hypothetical protein
MGARLWAGAAMVRMGWDVSSRESQMGSSRRWEHSRQGKVARNWELGRGIRG